jgi:hypothetical protein
MTLQTDIGITGAKRQSWKRANPRDVLKRIIDKNPEWDEEEVLTECWDILRRDQQQMRTVFEYWFDNNYRSLVRATAKPKPGARPEPEPTPATSHPATEERSATEERPAATALMTAAIREKIEERISHKVTIALLGMTLPSGKPLRLATREELLEAGGWMQRVAARLEPGQTVEEANLTENELRALYE